MANSPTSRSQLPSREEELTPEGCPPDKKLPENSPENLDERLDQALEETFPTSDPISVNVTKGGAIDDGVEAASAAALERRQGQDFQEGPGTAEDPLAQAKDTLADVATRMSTAGREAYDQGERYVRQTRERYPEVERYYQDGSRAVSQTLSEKPLLALFVAGAVGYAVAWMIHGKWGGRTERVPDYARTTRDYGPHRDDSRG